ncbi:TetR/AcrR family transcriptional regulator [Rhizobium alvei]|uniref:TetR/AcrR family transcriptional regulator n=1 Tax=Rhizobium alvei TaxID=1132659 RepID=A0ABT8YI50_9HYPH|nr:TetR/AcrR family transcriptional regulator [Rhizobium alvei]MDO6962993.1 TetR/AcrR family transcriptional regulator [Rhizobium alvei]
MQETATTKVSRYRRQPDAGLSRMEILEGAARSFQERGFAGTSIDDVAARIRSTKGRIYHHYSSKAELFFDVYRAGMEMNVAAIEPCLSAPGPADQRLHAMLRAHVRSMIETQAFQRVVWEGVEMLRQNALPEPEHAQLGELAELRHAYAERFRLVMEAARAEGFLAFQHSSIALNTAFMAVNGPVFWYRPREGQSAEEIEKIVDECALYAMRALGWTKDREVYADAEGQ